MSSVSKPRVRQNRHKQGLNQTLEKISADFRFFCFNGTVKAVMVATERQAGHTKFDFYDTNFQHLPFRWGHDHSSQELKKPQGFEAMLEVAANLSSGFPHVRVDLYNVEGKIYFGELTYFHWSGMCPFEPEEWDEKFGEWLDVRNVEG